MLGGSLSGRGRPDAKMMPTPGHRAATWRAKSAPLIEPAMLTSVKSIPMSASVSKNRRASSAFPASSTRYPASVNMPDAPIRSKTSSSTTRIAAWEGEPVTDGNQHRLQWFHICLSEYDYKAGTLSCRIGHHQEPSLSNWLAVLCGSLKGTSSVGRMRDGNRCSILYRLTFGMGLHIHRAFS